MFEEIFSTSVEMFPYEARVTVGACVRKNEGCEFQGFV
jgi:hypothetical protein